MSPRVGIVLAAWLGALLLFASRTAAADELRVRVRGGSRLEARAARDGDLVLRGILVDDGGQGIAGASVSARIAREDAADDAATAAAVRAARPCEGRAGLRVTDEATGPALAFDTDEGGRFCVRLRLAAARFVATLAWPGTPLVVGAEERLAFDASREALTLRFDPAPRVLPLDAARVTVEVVGTVDEGGVPAVARGIALVLVDERGTSLGRETTDATGRARFVVESSVLGPPGRGELRVSFDGNADVAAARETLDVERHAAVSMRVPAYEVTAGASPASPRVPDDGIELTVTVTTLRGPVGEGAVEARVGDVVVGAAPVDRGVARPVLTFSSLENAADVHLRYVPSSPWLRSESETTIRVALARPGLSSRAPVLLAGLAVLVFFFLGRLTASAKKAKPTAEEEADDSAREPVAYVEVVASSEDAGPPRWRGRVVDAHDRHGLAGARVWIEQGSFDGRTVVATAETDEAGRFELVAPVSTAAPAGGAQLGAEARLHARHLQALPRPGELSIALVARRRALLARLVAWARHAGHPFDARPEPTPGHVRRAAPGDEAARWADAVERAAFGQGEVDAAVEAHVDRLRPAKANVGPEAPPGEPVDRR